MSKPLIRMSNLVFVLVMAATLVAAAPATVHAQGCYDPAGAPIPCTPAPTCGLPGLPPCEPPPQQEPTDAPKPRPTRTPVPPTRTPAPTATPTATPTSTSTATTVPCDTNVLTAVLSGTNEIPSVLTEGKGVVTLLFDLNAGNITGSWSIKYLSGPITAAHIHTGAAAVKGPVFIPLSGLPPAAGTFATLNSAPIVAMQAVLANPPGFYVNVHTSAHPGGELRGQLTCAPAQPVPSPTPTMTSTPTSTPVGVAGPAGGPGGLRRGIGLGGLIAGGALMVLLGLRTLRNPGPPGAPEAQ